MIFLLNNFQICNKRIIIALWIGFLAIRVNRFTKISDFLRKKSFTKYFACFRISFARDKCENFRFFAKFHFDLLCETIGNFREKELRKLREKKIRKFLGKKCKTFTKKKTEEKLLICTSFFALCVAATILMASVEFFFPRIYFSRNFAFFA